MITFTYHVIDGHLLKPETPKGNHHREATGTAWTTETPIRKHRNHQNSYKNSSKTIETASMTLPLSISGWIIMNNNFLNTYRLFSSFSYCFIRIFAVSQSTYEEWKQKILLFFFLSNVTQCKVFTHVSTQRLQTTAYPVTEGVQIPKRLAWKRRHKQCKYQGNKQKFKATKR